MASNRMKKLCTSKELVSIFYIDLNFFPLSKNMEGDMPPPPGVVGPGIYLKIEFEK